MFTNTDYATVLGTFKYDKDEIKGGYAGSINIQVDLTSPLSVVEARDSKFTVNYLPPIQEKSH